MSRRTFLFAVLAGALAAAAPSAFAEEGPPPPSIIRVRPLMLPVIHQGRIEKYNTLEVTLELANATLVGQAQTLMPRLHDAILAVLYQGIDKGWIIRGDIDNPQAVRQRISEEGAKLLGQGTVLRILITPVARQSNWP